MALTESGRPSVTVEERGREIAARRQQKILSQEETVFRYVHSQDFDALSFPRLTPGDPELATRLPFQDDLRFNPINGEIYSTMWRNMSTEVDKDTGKRHVKFPKKIKDKRTGRSRDNYPENYLSLVSELPNGELSEIEDPEELPKTGQARRLIVNQLWDGLETAIRQQHHVLEGYDPTKPTSEPQVLRNMLYWLDNTSARLREDEVGKADLYQVALEAAKMVGKASLPSAIDETKQKIASMLSKAANIDSMGRVNSLVARTRLTSAKVAAVERILISELITSKFSANLGVLLAERFATRDAMTRASDELKSVQDQLRNGDVSYQARMDMARKVYRLAQYELRTPRVAPYLIGSRMASVFLAGSAGRHREEDSKILGEDFTKDVFKRVKGDEPFYAVNYLLANGHTTEAVRQIDWATSLIDDTLRESENIFPDEPEGEDEGTNNPQLP